MKQLWLIIFLLLPHMLLSISGEDATESNTLMDKAFSLLKEGEIVQSEKLFLEIINTQGESNDALIGLGRSILYQNRLDESLEIFIRAVNDFNTPEAWFFKGFNNYRLGHFDETETDYLKAIDLGYDKFDVYFNLGYMKFSENKYDEGDVLFRKSLDRNGHHDQSWYYLALCRYRRNMDAFYEFSKTIEINPQFTMAYIYRGYLYEKTGEYNKSVENYSVAVRLDPAYAWGWFYLGNSLKKIGQYENALKNLTKALDLGLLEDRVYDSLAGVYMLQKKNALAEETFNKALEAGPENPRIYNNRGDFYLHLEEYDKAIADFTKATQLAPDWNWPWNNLGYTYSVMGEHYLALKPLEKAIELDPEWSKAWNNYANALKNEGRKEEAVKSYLKAIECDPAYAKPYFNLGIHYHDEGEYEKAIEYYRKSLELNPGQSGCYNNLGISLGRLNKAEEAVDVFTRGLEVNPYNKLIPGNRGRQNYNLERYEEAVADLTKALEYKPDSAYFHKYLGMSLYSLKQYSKAEEHLLQAIELNSSYSDDLENMLGSIELTKSFLYIKLLWDDIPQEGIDVTFIGLPDYSTEYITDSQGYIKIFKSILKAEKNYLLYDGDYQNPNETWDFSNTGFLYNSEMNEVVLQITKKMSLLYPSEEEIISGGSPLLKWENPAGASTYKLTVSRKKGELNNKIMSFVHFLTLEDLIAPEYQLKQILTPDTYMASIIAYSEKGIPLYYASGKFTVR